MYHRFTLFERDFFHLVDFGFFNCLLKLRLYTFELLFHLLLVLLEI